MGDPSHDSQYALGRIRIEFKVGFVTLAGAGLGIGAAALLLAFTFIPLVVLPLEFFNSSIDAHWIALVFEAGALVGAIWGAGFAGLQIAQRVRRDLDDLTEDARTRWKRKDAELRRVSETQGAPGPLPR
ncbi:MAG: hypothetical protein ACM30I_08925 [Gemmatimonas sp.]